MSKHVCIISHQHLCRNPRVLKESITLYNAGFQVTILTGIYSEKLLKEDIELLSDRKIRYLFYNNLIKKDLKNYFNRALNKIGRYCNKLFFENKWALGYAPANCLKISLSLEADLYICHQELPLYIGNLLLKKGKKVAFDFEDWYSEDLLPNARKFRPNNLLKLAEKNALQYGDLVYTTSIPLADKLAQHYNTKTPNVLYNSFTLINLIEKNIKKNVIKLIWISQTIGPGRGLEDIVMALNKIENSKYELNLRGSVCEMYKQSLNNKLTNNLHTINFLPLIPNSDITNNLTNFDIGLALELDQPVSRDLTITNKIFHYLSVGLPVIASTTQGQLSIKNDFENHIYYYKRPDDLREILSKLNPFELRQNRQKILEIYKEKYDWALQEKKLQVWIKSIL